jgi:hypothetical protein
LDGLIFAFDWLIDDDLNLQKFYLIFV